MIAPPNSVLLLVGREDFEPPSSFAGRACVATADCVAVGVLSAADGPTKVTMSADAPAHGSIQLGSFDIETEGLLSVRDVYSREYLTVGIDPGYVAVTVWGNDHAEPSEVQFQVRVAR
jgi:hypothetical protein